MRTRPLSDSERSSLETALAGSRQQMRRMLAMLFGPSFTLLLLLAVLWAVVYWMGWRFFDLDLGLRSAAGPWILGIGALALVSIVGPEVLKIVRSTQSAVNALEADLASGTVEEMTIRIVDAMRYQESEHGGFLYFLHTTDDRVYVQFDYESQDLGVDNQDPEKSSYLPRDTLVVARTHHEGRVLASIFSGEPVQIVHRGMITAKPKLWPEQDTFCGTPWNELVSTYAA